MQGIFNTSCAQILDIRSEFIFSFPQFHDRCMKVPYIRSHLSNSYKNVTLLLCLLIKHALKIKSIDSEAPPFTEVR
jgi:hypothetical protein